MGTLARFLRQRESVLAVPPVGPGLSQKNRRLAMALVGWIALLSIASFIVIWVRN
ncbi:MAG: hypothetical protein HY724_11065 [Candidatus Rokubacteria bacterium]|nr:hypothetical protein [Candidatus Rokubacteria bacterium]